MSGRFRSKACLALAAALSLPAAAPAWAATAADAFVPETHEYLGKLERLGFAGVVLIARDGRPVLAEGYGLADRERDIPWNPSTVSTIGSITKQFTGAAILLLEQEGKLRAEDPITRFFDEVPEDKRSITLHQLLTHSSGIVDLEGYGDWDPIERDEFVRRSLAQPLAFAPGERYEYSNAGYSLLGAVIEQLSGGSWEKFVRERLLLPQGIYETGYVLPRWGEARMAQGYAGGERWGTVLGRPMAADGPYWVLRANGGIHATAYEMLRWAEALRNGRVLSAESMARYWAPQVSEGGDSSYGYGWVVTELGGLKIVTHNGGNGIFFADMAIVPETGVVVFLQTNVASDFPLAEELLQRVGMRMLGGQPYPEVPRVVDVDPAALSRAAGVYGLDGGGAIRVSAGAAGLAVEPAGPRAFQLLHSSQAVDAARGERLNRRIDEIAGGVARGDYDPLWEAYRQEVPLERLGEVYGALMRDLKQQLGPFRSHEVLGTAREDDRDHTVVRLNFERGHRDVTFVWDAGEEQRLLGRSVRGLDPVLRFVPVAGGGFASWNGRATHATLTRAEGAGGAQGGLASLRSPLGEVRLERRADGPQAAGER